MTLGGILVCLHWQPNLVGTVSFRAGTLANRLFFERAIWGDWPPAWLQSRPFLIFSYDLFKLLFERFGLFSPDTFPSFLSLPKKKKYCFSAYWLRSSARVLFCAFTRMGQLLDYCSHFKLLGFAMVEHRDAGSW